MSDPKNPPKDPNDPSPFPPPPQPIPAVKGVNYLASDGNPRRIHLDLATPIETQCRELLWAIEKLGAHPLLTDAVVLVDDAREKLADWLEETGNVLPEGAENLLDKKVIKKRIKRGQAENRKEYGR